MHLGPGGLAGSVPSADHAAVGQPQGVLVESPGHEEVRPTSRRLAASRRDSPSWRELANCRLKRASGAAIGLSGQSLLRLRLLKSQYRVGKGARQLARLEQEDRVGGPACQASFATGGEDA